MRIPKAVEKLIESFEKLPGIGPKTAQRLTFYLLHVPQYQLEEFANNLSGLKANTNICSKCFAIGDGEVCSICDDLERDQTTICVVEDALDVLAIERGGKYKGLYHVLHGVIDPLNGLGPDDIYIPQLSARLKAQDSKVQEVIIATNPTMEGEATAMYIVQKLKSSSFAKASEDKQNSLASRSGKVKITRIGHGLPIGADLEYADEQTLQRAIEGRREY